MKIERVVVSVLAGLMTGSCGMMAQTPVNKNLLQVETLMSTYHFDEAAELLQKEIKTAQRKKQSTATLETTLADARKREEMLLGTEKVVFIDSVVVDRENFLSAFRLSKETGRIGKLGALFPKMQWGRQNPDATGYVNELGDKAYFAAPDSKGEMKLFTSDCLGNTWGTPEPLSGIGDSDSSEGYPFVMADGVTLYYAAQGPESIGGYDIFVTRYNPDTHAFVRSENIGMPFNSPANDYLYVVDETANIGWFVSDRNQPANKVCVYTFIPNESRDVYNLDTDGEEKVRRAARIAAIADTQRDKSAVSAARQRLSQIEQRDEEEDNPYLRFVINDRTVYTRLSQFRKPVARRLAAQWLQTEEQRQQLEQLLSEARLQYGRKHDPRMKSQIFQWEKDVEDMAAKADQLAKEMRKAELQ